MELAPEKSVPTASSSESSPVLNVSEAVSPQSAPAQSVPTAATQHPAPVPSVPVGSSSLIQLAERRRLHEQRLKNVSERIGEQKQAISQLQKSRTGFQYGDIFQRHQVQPQS
jgi:hypothetical protein